jgi:DNA-binding response OmpR family regulator
MTSLLLIDDDPQFCSMLAERLRGEGYAVTTAADGKPGLAEFRRTDYALVILDIILPDMEGLETLHELRRVKASAKVIAISGGGMGDSDTYLRSARLLGADAVFAKPLDWPAFLAALHRLLGEPD